MEGFQTQYNVELANSLFYTHLANQAEALAWDGFAAFLKKSADEEREHAEHFREFLLDRNVFPRVTTIPAPTAEGREPIDWIRLAYQAEQQNTKRLADLYWGCVNAKDADAAIFLEPLVTEQRTSERELSDLLQRLSRAGSNAAVLLIESECAK